uniref:C-C motif chemokine receptor 8 n=1 Tax=Leptobrachium leishanense TaxID=445787 RepID=A0A8C5M4J5_9ANUR
MNVTATDLSSEPTTDEYEYPDTPPCDYDTFESFKHIIKPVLYSFTFSFGFVGNVLVMIVLVCCKKLSTMTDVYLLNMAISDMIFVFSLPFVVYTVRDHWVFGLAMCKILSALYFTGFYAGIFFIVIMSVDRYLAVVHVVFSLKVRTFNWGIIISVITWVIAFLFSIPMFSIHQVQGDKGQESCSIVFPENSIINWKLFPYISINIFGLIVPLGFLMFCYSQIIRSLYKSKNKQKRYAIRLILIVVIVFFIFWSPYNVTLFLHMLKKLNIIKGCEVGQRLELAFDVTETLTFVHCCLNPVIYAFAGEKFKKYLKEIINKPFRWMKKSNIRKSFQSSVTDRMSSSSKDTRASSVTEI